MSEKTVCTNNDEKAGNDVINILTSEDIGLDRAQTTTDFDMCWNK